MAWFDVGPYVDKRQTNDMFGDLPITILAPMVVGSLRS